MSEDLMKRFESARTLTDVYIIARSLKVEGVDSFTVNECVTKAKKLITSRVGEVKRINRTPIQMPDIPEIPTTQFYIELKHLNRPIIEVHEDGRVVL